MAHAMVLDFHSQKKNHTDEAKHAPIFLFFITLEPRVTQTSMSLSDTKVYEPTNFQVIQKSMILKYEPSSDQVRDLAHAVVQDFHVQKKNHTDGTKPVASKSFLGKTAKQLSVEIFEGCVFSCWNGAFS